MIHHWANPLGKIDFNLINRIKCERSVCCCAAPRIRIRVFNKCCGRRRRVCTISTCRSSWLERIFHALTTSAVHAPHRIPYNGIWAPNEWMPLNSHPLFVRCIFGKFSLDKVAFTAHKLLSLVEYDACTAVRVARRRRRRHQRNEIHLSTFESPDKHSCNPWIFENDSICFFTPAPLPRRCSAWIVSNKIHIKNTHVSV